MKNTCSQTADVSKPTNTSQHEIKTKITTNKLHQGPTTIQEKLVTISKFSISKNGKKKTPTKKKPRGKVQLFF